MLRFAGPHPTGYLIVLVVALVLIAAATYALERGDRS